MNETKKLLFIGNRTGVYKELQQLPGINVIEVLALRDSYLHAGLIADRQECFVFSLTEKDLIFSHISETEFDILVSNGCPFILPVSHLKRGHQLFLNVHPSFLPDGRGRHPINGAILHNTGFIGATLHYMDDGVDTGNIVYQEHISITDDLDLGLLYRMSFELEARVFREGMHKLAAADYQFLGLPHSGKGSYYSRRPEDQLLDLVRMSDDEILRRVRAFGVRSQGATCRTEIGIIQIFEAEKIINPYLHKQYAMCSAGQIILHYDDRLLVKTREGIIKVKSYVPLHKANT